MTAALCPLLVCAALGLVPSSTEPRSTSTAIPYVYVRSEPAPLLLRGDWEPPAAVAVAYQPAWPDTLVGFLDAATRRLPVLLLLKGDSSLQAAKIWLGAHGFEDDQVTPIEAALDTVWVRDGGPLQRVNRTTGEVRWLDAQYATRPNDDLLPQLLAAYTGTPIDPFPVDLDGGAIISNGRGLCVATEESMVDTGIDFEHPEPRDYVLGALGCDALVEVPALAADPTRHVDMLAQFIAPDTIIVAQFDSALAAEDASRMDEAVERLRDASRATGRPLDIVRIPVPPPSNDVYYSAINGLRLHDAFIVPVFDAVPAASQRETLASLRAAMPGVSIIRVRADDPIALNGGIHCLAFGIHAESPERSHAVATLRSRSLRRPTGLAPVPAPRDLKPCPGEADGHRLCP